MSVTDAMSRLQKEIGDVGDDRVFMETYGDIRDPESVRRLRAEKRFRIDCEMFKVWFLDPAPIDEAWLREMGGTGPDEYGLIMVGEGFPSVTFDAEHNEMHGNDQFGSSIVVRSPTRGRFRALLHGLGMEVRG